MFFVNCGFITASDYVVDDAIDDAIDDVLMFGQRPLLGWYVYVVLPIIVDCRGSCHCRGMGGTRKSIIDSWSCL